MKRATGVIVLIAVLTLYLLLAVGEALGSEGAVEFYLKDGSVFIGEWRSYFEEGFHIRTAYGSLEIPASDIYYIRLVPSFEPSLYYEEYELPVVVLRDGSILEAEIEAYLSTVEDVVKFVSREEDHAYRVDEVFGLVLRRPTEWDPMDRAVLDSNPSGASVLADGETIGKTPIYFDIIRESAEDAAEIEVVETGYHSQKLTIIGIPQGAVTFTANLIRTGQPVEGEGIWLTSEEARLYRQLIEGIGKNQYLDTGKPMKMGTIEYTQGFSLKGRWDSREAGSIVFNLGGRFSRLTGKIGFDDRIQKERTVYRATVSFIGDNKELESYTVRAGHLPQKVELNLSGVTNLTVSVDYPTATGSSARREAARNVVNIVDAFLWY